MPQILTLLGALAFLAAWTVLTFITPVGVGAVHLLLGAGVTLLVRWLALRAQP